MRNPPPKAKGPSLILIVGMLLSGAGAGFCAENARHASVDAAHQRDIRAVNAMTKHLQEQWADHQQADRDLIEADRKLMESSAQLRDAADACRETINSLTNGRI